MHQYTFTHTDTHTQMRTHAKHIHAHKAQLSGGFLLPSAARSCVHQTQFSPRRGAHASTLTTSTFTAHIDPAHLISCASC